MEDDVSFNNNVGVASSNSDGGNSAARDSDRMGIIVSDDQSSNMSRCIQWSDGVGIGLFKLDWL